MKIPLQTNWLFFKKIFERNNCVVDTKKRRDIKKRKIKSKKHKQELKKKMFQVFFWFAVIFYDDEYLTRLLFIKIFDIEKK